MIELLEKVPVQVVSDFHVDYIEKIPDEILLEIFKKLNFIDLSNSAGVCKRFYSISKDFQLPCAKHVHEISLWNRFKSVKPKSLDWSGTATQTKLLLKKIDSGQLSYNNCYRKGSYIAVFNPHGLYFIDLARKEVRLLIKDCSFASLHEDLLLCWLNNQKIAIVNLSFAFRFDQANKPTPEIDMRTLFPEQKGHSIDIIKCKAISEDSFFLLLRCGKILVLKICEKTQQIMMTKVVEIGSLSKKDPKNEKIGAWVWKNRLIVMSECSKTLKCLKIVDLTNDEFSPRGINIKLPRRFAKDSSCVFNENFYTTYMRDNVRQVACYGLKGKEVFNIWRKDIEQVQSLHCEDSWIWYHASDKITILHHKTGDIVFEINFEVNRYDSRKLVWVIGDFLILIMPAANELIFWHIPTKLKLKPFKMSYDLSSNMAIYDIKAIDGKLIFFIISKAHEEQVFWEVEDKMMILYEDDLQKLKI